MWSVASNKLVAKVATRLAKPVGEQIVGPGEEEAFLAPNDVRVHAMLRAISRNTCFSRLEPADMAPASAFLASPDEYRKRFAVLPGAVDNTERLLEHLTFRGPEFGTVMPPFDNGSGVDPGRLLRQKTCEGTERRYGYPLPRTVKQRINYELAIIREKRFCEYFLVVERIVAQSPRTCGRGSGAASVVAYCLGITNVCPVKYNLYFERFLNPGRKDPPDIDVDFAWDERDAVLEWVLNRFPGHSAMVASHTLFQPRMAVREAARVFGLPDGEIGRVSKKLPWFWKESQAGEDLLSHIKQRPQFRSMDFPEPWPAIMAYAQKILGTPRHLSVHPGGVVITPRPIDHYVPVERAPKGVALMQWEKEAAEEAGLVKIDLLGNRSLGVIRDTVAAIESKGERFDDFAQDPEEDMETRHNVAQGNTMGCFYIESPAIRLLQKKSRVGDFHHVVIHSSIIRPAANEFVREYIRRLHTGLWHPMHPLLADVLDDTLGIMVFQEDVSRVAVTLAGFSHEDADALRKIMSKKEKDHVLDDYKKRFQAGASARGVPMETITAVCYRDPETYARQIELWMTSLDLNDVKAGIIALGEMGNPKDIPRLKEMLTGKRETHLSAVLIDSLSKLEADNIGLLAEKNLFHPLKETMIAALKALTIQNDTQLKKVITLFSDPDLKQQAMEKVKLSPYKNSSLLMESLNRTSLTVQESLFTLLEEMDISSFELFEYFKTAIQSSYNCLAVIRTLEQAPSHRVTDLMSRHMEQRKTVFITTALKIFTIKDSTNQMQPIFKSFCANDSRSRANAVEAIESMLAPPLRTMLMPLIDGSSLAKAIKTGKHFFSLPDFKNDISKICTYLAGQKNTATVMLALSTALVKKVWDINNATLDTLTESDNTTVKKLALQIKQGESQTEEENMNSPLPLYEKILHLQKANIFKNLAVNELAAIASIAREAVYQPGHRICRQGEVAQTMYITVSGRIKATRNDVVMGEFTTGDSFGLSAFLVDDERLLSCTIEEETRLLEIHKNEFQEMLMEYPLLSFEIARIQTRRIHKLLKTVDPQKNQQTNKIFGFSQK